MDELMALWDGLVRLVVSRRTEMILEGLLTFLPTESEGSITDLANQLRVV